MSRFNSGNNDSNDESKKTLPNESHNEDSNKLRDKELNNRSIYDYSDESQIDEQYSQLDFNEELNDPIDDLLSESSLDEESDSAELDVQPEEPNVNAETRVDKSSSKIDAFNFSKRSVSLDSQIGEIQFYFDANWDPERNFSIEDALDHLPRGVSPEKLRETFKELLFIDLEKGAKNNALLSSSEYKSRFPQFSEEIDETVENAMNYTSIHRQMMVGSRIGNLLIEEFIGKGQFGIVYKARNEALARYEAVKMLKPLNNLSKSAQEERLALFRREATTAANLNDSRYAEIYDVGRYDDKILYLKMEYIDGVDLQSYLTTDKKRVKPISWEEAARYVCEIAKGLRVIHEKGVYHRDLKPANIMLDVKKQIHILDLGLACLRPLDGAQIELSAIDDKLNNSKAGSPAYMSPESFNAPEEVDGQSDIYSLGGIFFFLVAGLLPIVRYDPRKEQSKPRPLSDFFDDAETKQSTIEKVKKTLGIEQSTTDDDKRPVKRPAPPCEYAELMRVMEKALEPDRKKRYKTAQDIVDDIERILYGQSQEEIVKNSRKARIREHFELGVISILIVALVYVLGLLCNWWLPPRPTVELTKKENAIVAVKDAYDVWRDLKTKFNSLNAEEKKSYYKKIKEILAGVSVADLINVTDNDLEKVKLATNIDFKKEELQELPCSYYLLDGIAKAEVGKSDEDIDKALTQLRDAYKVAPEKARANVLENIRKYGNKYRLFNPDNAAKKKLETIDDIYNLDKLAPSKASTKQRWNMAMEYGEATLDFQANSDQIKRALDRLTEESLPTSDPEFEKIDASARQGLVEERQRLREELFERWIETKFADAQRGATLQDREKELGKTTEILDSDVGKLIGETSDDFEDWRRDELTIIAEARTDALFQLLESDAYDVNAADIELRRTRDSIVHISSEPAVALNALILVWKALSTDDVNKRSGILAPAAEIVHKARAGFDEISTSSPAVLKSDEYLRAFDYYRRIGDMTYEDVVEKDPPLSSDLLNAECNVVDDAYGICLLRPELEPNNRLDLILRQYEAFATSSIGDPATVQSCLEAILNGVGDDSVSRDEMIAFLFDGDNSYHSLARVKKSLEIFLNSPDLRDKMIQTLFDGDSAKANARVNAALIACLAVPEMRNALLAGSREDIIARLQALVQIAPENALLRDFVVKYLVPIETVDSDPSKALEELEQLSLRTPDDAELKALEIDYYSFLALVQTLRIFNLSPEKALTILSDENKSPYTACSNPLALNENKEWDKLTTTEKFFARDLFKMVGDEAYETRKSHGEKWDRIQAEANNSTLEALLDDAYEICLRGSDAPTGDKLEMRRRQAEVCDDGIVKFGTSAAIPALIDRCNEALKLDSSCQWAREALQRVANKKYELEENYDSDAQRARDILDATARQQSNN